MGSTLDQVLLVDAGEVRTCLTVKAAGLSVIAEQLRLTARISSISIAGTCFARGCCIGLRVTMRYQRKTILRGGRLESPNISNPLPHIDSDWCWCDPIVEFSEDGNQLVVHKEVIWN